MAAWYTKTALKKIKKDDLVQFYLDQQQKLQETRKIAEELQKHRDTTYSKDHGWMNEIAGKMFTEKDIENEKLKQKLEDVKEEYEKDLKEVKEEYWEKGWETGKSDTWDEIDDAVKPLKEQIEELKKQNKVKEIHETMLEGKKLKEELKVVERALGDIKKLKEENDNWEADDKNLTKIICMINALDEDYSVNGVDDIYECVKNLKEEGATNQRRATIYEYMSEFMEKADCMGAYFDFIREYYPDEREAAGDCWTSDEEEEEV